MPIKQNRQPLEVKDQRITGCEISGDGESWENFSQSQFVGNGGGLPALLDLLINGEHVYVRTKYVDIYTNGTNGLPKTGPILELKVIELAPVRKLIEAHATTLQQIETRGNEPGAGFTGFHLFSGASPLGKCAICTQPLKHEIHQHTPHPYVGVNRLTGADCEKCGLEEENEIHAARQAA